MFLWIHVFGTTLCPVESASGWMISLYTAALVRETLSFCPNCWTAAFLLNSLTVTTGLPFTIHAGIY